MLKKERKKNLNKDWFFVFYLLVFLIVLLMLMHLVNIEMLVSGV